MTMPLIELENLDFGYTSSLVVRGLNFSINEGQIVAIMGPSGCGKSTALRLMAGLEKPIAGKSLFDGHTLDVPSPLLRFSFQDYDAFPWRTARQNLILASGRNNDACQADNIDVLINKIGLTGHEHKYPTELSGGMRKRLALGRCLAGRPKVVLLDEPFSSLDVDAKHEMYTIIQSLWLILKCSFVIVTHDIHEAIILSHKVFISSPLPMRKKAEVNISFDYPREEMLSKTNEYMELSNKIRELLT